MITNVLADVGSKEEQWCLSREVPLIPYARIFKPDGTVKRAFMRTEEALIAALMNRNGEQHERLVRWAETGERPELREPDAVDSVTLEWRPGFVGELAKMNARQRFVLEALAMGHVEPAVAYLKREQATRERKISRAKNG